MICKDCYGPLAPLGQSLRRQDVCGRCWDNRTWWAHHFTMFTQEEFARLQAAWSQKLPGVTALMVMNELKCRLSGGGDYVI